MINQKLGEILDEMDQDLPVRIIGLRETLDVVGAYVRIGEDGQRYISLQTDSKAK